MQDKERGQGAVFRVQKKGCRVKVIRGQLAGDGEKGAVISRQGAG